MTAGIYSILNIHTNKEYIGYSVNLEYRKRQHFLSLEKGHHQNVFLQESFDTWNRESFKFMVLEEIDLKLVSRDSLCALEKKWIDSRSPEFNILFTENHNHTRAELSSKTLDRLKRLSSNYWGNIVDPEGKVYEDVINLSEFCREHRLDLMGMRCVLYGKRKHYKGWTKGLLTREQEKLFGKKVRYLTNYEGKTKLMQTSH